MKKDSALNSGQTEKLRLFTSFTQLSVHIFVSFSETAEASVTVNLQAVECIFKFGKLFITQHNFGCTEVFDDPLFVFGARERHHIRILMQHPRQGNPGRSRLFLFGKASEHFNDRLISLRLRRDS